MYCPALGNITKRKQYVEKKIKNDHKKAKDMHRYLSRNEDKYKGAFVKAYNKKCSYCGVSEEIIPKDNFEIDHFLYWDQDRFHHKKAEAGYMDNLVLACHMCNHKIGDFEINGQDIDKLHPDKNLIDQFKRNDDFSISIVNDKDAIVEQFYNKLGLGNELKRLDYLLISMYGLMRKISSIEGLAEAYLKVGIMADMLRRKRNEL